MIEIAKATESAFEEARSFYHDLIDAMNKAGLVITWVKDVYPASDFLETAANKGELYLGRENGEIAAAMVLNSECSDAYRTVRWPSGAVDAEALVVHALGVHPRFGGRGLGALMTMAAIEIASKADKKAVRLDVLRGNEPARRIYEKCGFGHVADVQMYYENTGLADFELFEYVLPQAKREN